MCISATFLSTKGVSEFDEIPFFCKSQSASAAEFCILPLVYPAFLKTLHVKVSIECVFICLASLLN